MEREQNESDAQPAAEQGSGSGQRVYPGSSLNWESRPVAVQLHAELPFWLLMPDCELRVTHEEVTLNLAIRNQWFEVQSGNGFCLSHLNARHIGDMSVDPPDDVRAEIKDDATPVTFRAMRTIASVRATALVDAWDALHEDRKRLQDGRQYFGALILGHIPFLNRVINAYRRSAYDPFVAEVTDWHLPIWFISCANKLQRVCLVPYAEYDRLPTFGHDGGSGAFEAFAHPLGVQEALGGEPCPGEIELLDAWGLYYQGRYADGIRALVTAIEVLLEAKIRDLLIAKGYSAPSVEAALKRTYNDFDERLAEYVRLTGKRVPGPLMSWIPYINGVRLKEELEQTRNLRHKIVHEGRRLDQTYQPLMLRAIETMSWLFDWLEDDQAKSPIRFSAYQVKAQLRGKVLLGYEYSNNRVVVVKPTWCNTDEPPMLVEDLLTQQLVAALNPVLSDLDKFAAMCFSRLDFDEVEESRMDPCAIGTHPERFYLRDKDETVFVFLLEADSTVSVTDLYPVVARALAIRQDRGIAPRLLCVVNHQRGADWRLRETTAAVEDDAAQLVEQCGISIVTSVDLLFLVLGVGEKSWSSETVKETLRKPGRTAAKPPGTTEVGWVRHFYDKPHVASVVVTADAGMKVGDTVIIRLRDRYHRHVVRSIQVNRSPVALARQGEWAGIECDLRRNDVPLGAKVYSVNPSCSDEPPVRTEVSFDDRAGDTSHGVPELSLLLHRLVSVLRQCNRGPMTELAPSILQSAFGQSPRILARQLNNLGTLFHADGNFAEAMTCGRRSLSLFEREGDLIGVAAANRLLGLVLRESNDFDGAQRHLAVSHRIWEAEGWPVHGEAVATLSDLLVVRLDSGQLDTAEQTYHQLLALIEKGVELDPQRRAAAFDAIAVFHRLKGRDDESEVALRKGYDVWEKAKWPPREQTLITLENLIGCLVNGNKPDGAAFYIEKHLEQVKKIFGDTHPMVVKFLTESAIFHRSRGQKDAALRLCRQAIQVCENLNWPRIEEISVCQVFALTLLIDEGEFTEAESLAKSSLRRAEQEYGDLSPGIIPGLVTLSSVYREWKKFDEAETLLKRSLELVGAGQGEPQPHYHFVLENYARLLRCVGGRDIEARTFEQELEKLRIRPSATAQ